jgi:serine phosphatase RsbU (regulator of sigma subunit)
MSPPLPTFTQPPGLQPSAFVPIALGVLLALLAVACLWLWLRLRQLSASASTGIAGQDSDAEFWASLASAPAIPAEIAESAYLHFAEHFEAEDFQVGTFGDSTFTTLFRVRDGTHQPNLHFPIGLHEPGIIGWVRDTGQALRVDDFQTQASQLPAHPSYQSDDPPSSGVFVPLRAGEAVFGLLALQSRRPSAYSPHDLHRICSLATPLASALASALLGQEAVRRARRLALLREIAIRITSLAPLPELLPEIASLLHAGAGWGTVSVFERQGDRLLLRALAGEATGVTPTLSLADPGPVVSAVEQSATVRELEQPVGLGLPQIQAAAIPLRVEGSVLGALHVRAAEGKTLDAEELDLAETASHQLALVLLEARNFAQQQEESWITTVLLEVARHAAQPGDAMSALQAVLRLTTLLAGTSWAVLLLPDPDTGALQIGPSAGLRRATIDELPPMRLLPAALGIQSPYREGEQILGVDLPPPLSDVTASSQALALSLSDGESLLGVLLLEALEMPGDRPALLTGIAHQISLRIENSRLVEQVATRRSLEREIAMARDIQTSFLPRDLPEYPGWDLGVTWQLARMVGGDFYDFFRLPDGPNGPRWAVVVADVADKGIPASLFMALSRTLLRSVAFSRIDPGQVLQRANDLIISDAQSDMFVSVIYGMWEPAIARFAFANGGHNPPVLLRPGQDPTLLIPHGMVLGVREAERYETHSLSLEHGMALVLYTDGVTDTTDPSGLPFGTDRLVELLRRDGDTEAQALSAAIHSQVSDYSSGTELDDDLTVVVLRRLTAPAHDPEHPRGRP